MSAVAGASSEAPNNPTDEGRPANIAVVDDDSGFAGYLRTFLALRGYEARSYTRGDEIVAAIRQGEPPDIVAQAVRALAPTRRAPCRATLGRLTTESSPSSTYRRLLPRRT